MTGYHIEIGYNPGRSDYDKMWKILKVQARLISYNVKAIAAEVRRIGGLEECEDGCCKLDEFVLNYAEPFSNTGHPIKIIERGEVRQIMQLASTSGPFKYHVRRAYVRLLIAAMHQHDIEVSLHVA